MHLNKIVDLLLFVTMIVFVILQADGTYPGNADNVDAVDSELVASILLTIVFAITSLKRHFLKNHTDADK